MYIYHTKSYDREEPAQEDVVEITLVWCKEKKSMLKSYAK